MIRATCPHVRTLEALLGAEGIGTDSEELVHHLETCVDCQHVLQTLAADATLWEDVAQGLGDEAREEPALHRLVEQLKSDDPMPAEELSFLRPADKPGLLGLLGPYEVEEVIGRGGMGVVLKALDPTLNRVVAIKVLSPFLACSATARRRFTRETKAAAAVCHDHVVTVHAVAEIDGLPYLVMQFVAGESLQARLDHTRPLDVVEIVRIGLQTAEGLAAAHAQGLIHRDIKPANLLLENGLARVRITDFGLARMVDDVGLTRDGVVAGTPEYMAPEQARGESVDHRSDLFSLGSVLYAMCAGSPPFRGSSTVAVLRRVSDDQPIPVRSLNPEIPAWLDAFISRLLAKDPAQRFRSATEVASLLKGYLAHFHQPGAVRAPGLPGLAEESPDKVLRSTGQSPGFRKRSTLSRFCTVAAVAAFGLAIVLWYSAGRVGTNPAGKVDEKPGMHDRVSFDFRQQIEKLPPCTLFGPNLDVAVTTDAKGLRIARASGHTYENTGVDVPVTLRGDFDIAMGYELLAIGEPLPIYGAGIGLRVLFGEPTVLTALISRARKPAGEQFGTYRLIKDAKGQDRYQTVMETNAAAPFGRLRVRRLGSQLEFLVADGGSEYKRLRSVEIGREDVRLVRIYATTTDRPVLIDVRFTDLDIRADEISRSTTAAAPGSVVPGAPPSRPGLTVVVVLGLLLLLTLASTLGIWLFVRRRNLVAQPASSDLGQDKLEAAPPRLGFSCTACGRKLKITADFAGKKVKCPACGEVVRIPAAKSSEAITDRA